MHAVPDSPARAVAQRRSRQEWMLLGAVLLALLAFGIWSRHAAHRGVDAQERQRLEVQARTLDHNFGRQLVGAYEALQSAREQVPLWAPAERRTVGSRELRALSDAMPGVSMMKLLDVEGRVVASSRLELLDRDFADDAQFRLARQRADPAVLLLSPPFRTVLGVVSMNLALVVPSPEGRFGGVLTATLDPEYLQVVLNSVLYAPDMWAGVAHGDGRVLMNEPLNERVVGMDLARPGSFFTRHRESGLEATVLTGTVHATGRRGMLAQRTVRPASLPLDSSMIVTVGRDLDAMFAAWREQTAVYLLLYLLFGAAASLALLTLQRRAREAERVSDAQQAGRRESAERVELALRGGDLGLWDLDVRSNFALVNERWNTMLGRPHDAKDDGTHVWRSLVHPEDWPRVSAAQQAHLDGLTERFEAVYRMRHAEDRWVWVHDRGQVLERDRDGKPMRMVGTHLDITERMEAQEALRRNEESLAITLESIGDAVIATDPQGIVTRVNGAAQRLTGWLGDAAVGRPLGEVFRIFNARTRKPAVDPVGQVIERGEIVGLANDTVLVARDGREYQIADSAAPIRDRSGAVVGVVLVFSDVTERYRTEQALRRNEERLRSLLDNLAAGVIVHGADSVVLDANPVACQVTGLTLDQLRGRAVVDPHWAFLEEDGSPMPHERFPVAQVLASGAPLRNFVVGMRRPDLDHLLWALCNAYPVRDAEGTIEQVVVTFIDVTERMQASEGLRLLGAAIERLNDVVMITEAEPQDEPGPRIVFVNAAFERLTGWPVGEAIGRTPRMLQGPKTDRAELARIGAALRRCEPVHSELVNYTRQGAEYWVELDIVPLADRSGRITHMVSIERDITERKALERQVRESQKMESIGTLAGGIAHDFNNILAAILGNVALAREDAGAAHPVQASLDQINRAGLRARHLVQQILAFSRQEPHGLTSQSLRPVIEETLDLLRATLPATVRLEAALGDELVSARTDATQLQQVLMNLCTNAWHALPEQGGRIEVGLEAVPEAGPLRERLPGLPAGRLAHVWVRDNGHGMDTATRERIFEPFFTTKPVGQGTGLGLPVVHGIVRSHDGRIAVDSTLGQGSTFHIYLPWSDPEASEPTPAQSGAAAPRGAGQHVLYIDDDEVLVLMVEQLLQRAGFRVSTESDPAAALARVRDEPLAFDAVVTDFNMPELSGLEVARQVAALRPGLPVVISSGHLSEELRRQASAAGVRGLLKKEHTLEELVDLLLSLLGSDAGRARARVT